MAEEKDLLARRFSREDLLKLAAVTGGAGLVAGRTGLARAASTYLAQETGRLQVLDWAGYGNDGGQAMFAQYVKTHPQNKPKFTYMGNEADALAKIHAGLKPDLFRPYVGWIKYFAASGLVQPWDPKLISNFKHLNPYMVKAGQYQGKQYGIPADWGFDAILYRSDKVKPKAKSWSLLFDERYKGKIAWYDDITMLRRRPVPRVQEHVEPDGRPAQAVTEAAHLQEAPRPEDLVVRDRPVAALRIRRRLDRLRVAERLGADEEERAEGRLHAPEGEADRLGRELHAAQGDIATAARPCLRRCLELDQVGEVARGQLRLRACEHGRAAIVERPAARAPTDQPAGRYGAECVYGPRHPAPGALRQNVGTGESLLTGLI